MAPLLDPDDALTIVDPSELTVAQKTEMFEVYGRLHAAMERVTALEGESLQLRARLRQALQHRDALLEEHDALLCVGDHLPLSRRPPYPPPYPTLTRWTIVGVAIAVMLYTLALSAGAYRPCVCSCVIAPPCGGGGDAADATTKLLPSWPELAAWVTVRIRRWMTVAAAV